MLSFDSLAASLVCDSKLALLLLEAGPGPAKLRQARAILLGEGRNGIEIEQVGQSDPVILLVRTTPERARQLVITLTENGFTRLKSIYPARPAPAEG